MTHRQWHDLHVTEYLHWIHYRFPTGRRSVLISCCQHSPKWRRQQRNLRSPGSTRQGGPRNGNSRHAAATVRMTQQQTGQGSSTVSWRSDNPVPNRGNPIPNTHGDNQSQRFPTRFVFPSHQRPKPWTLVLCYPICKYICCTYVIFTSVNYIYVSFYIVCKYVNSFVNNFSF